MTIIGNAGPPLKITISKTVKNVNQQVLSRATRTVNELRNAELEVLSGQRGGKIYRKPHTKAATYRASAPGEPPARRSGNLRLRWNGKVKGGNSSSQVIASLESRVKYAALLDEGTPGGKIAPRPFKQPIIDKAMPKIEAIFREPYN